MSRHLPPGVKTFGPNANCTLDTCPAEWSIYGFRPSLAANATFLGLFIAVGLVHGYLGYRWKSWGFMAGMILGCLCEVIGYAGRIMLYNNPFSFVGFMVQIGKSAHLHSIFTQYRLTKHNLSLSNDRTCLLHRIHLRHPLQDNRLLRPRPIPLQPHTLLLDLHPLRCRLPCSPGRWWRHVNQLQR